MLIERSQTLARTPAGRKEKGKEARETGRQERVDPKERDGPRENGQNPGHTWHSSWHHSNWHGKTYGLEVDPWTAVELVPYLCAVSLN